MIEFFADEKYLDDLDKRWEEIIPHILHYNETVDHENLQTVSCKIREYYLGDNNVNRQTYDDLVQVSTMETIVYRQLQSNRFNGAKSGQRVGQINRHYFEQYFIHFR